MTIELISFNKPEVSFIEAAIDSNQGDTRHTECPINQTVQLRFEGFPNDVALLRTYLDPQTMTSIGELTLKPEFRKLGLQLLLVDPKRDHIELLSGNKVLIDANKPTINIVTNAKVSKVRNRLTISPDTKIRAVLMYYPDLRKIA